jgi:transposase-like protein
MAKAPTIQEFFKKFPTDDVCLEHLMMLRFGNPLCCPKCGVEGQFAKLKKHPAYACPTCGHHIHPMQGTPFERSHTPLTKWFYAMYLFTTTRNGVSAKELQRQLGVTYKTAWRIGHEIRKYMTQVDGDDGLSGHVEADEAYIGGKRAGAKQGFTGRAAKGKTIVFGMVERGGDIITRVVPNASVKPMFPHIIAKVEPGSTISTDEWPPYKRLRLYPYEHLVVKHAAKQWVDGKAHTNTIEAFWGQLKRGIRGTHIHVSRKHLPKYLGEFEFRWNLRHAPETMFARLLTSF